MGVINSELPKVVTLNGRRSENKGAYSVTLNPGLNTVPDEDLKLLKKNERFRDMVDRGEASEVKQQKSSQGEPGPPKDVNDIDITAMNVRNGRDVIDSCADVVLLNKWEKQEKDGEQRKGVLDAIAEQQEKLENLGKKEE